MASHRFSIFARVGLEMACACRRLDGCRETGTMAERKARCERRRGEAEVEGVRSWDRRRAERSIVTAEWRVVGWWLARGRSAPAVGADSVARAVLVLVRDVMRENVRCGFQWQL